MRHDKFYEDEMLNEAPGATVASLIDDAIKGGWKGVTTAAKWANKNKKARSRKIGSFVVPGAAKDLTFKTVGDAKSSPYPRQIDVTDYKAIKDAIKNNKKNPKEIAKTLKKEVWDKRTGYGKAKLGFGAAAAGGLAHDAAGDSDGRRFVKTKAMARNTAKTAKNVAKFTVSSVPNAALTALGIGTAGIAGTTSSVKGFVDALNDAHAKGILSTQCVLTPSKCEATIVRMAKKFYDKTKGAVTGTTSAVKNAKPSTKIAAGVGALAAGAVAAKLIKDALERKDWYNNGCDKIADPEKKAICKSHVHDKVKKDLESKLKRCKFANNPEKCVAIVKQKLKELK